MVIGMNSFRDKFRDYVDCYTIIGGAACDILMSENGAEFRATKDIDMILILEDNSRGFGKVFWEYIKEAGYKCGWKNSDKVHFYRFTEPNPGYPAMIELFSRLPGYHLDVGTGIIPIHIDDNTSSLSAILLNDDFYNFMMQGRTVVNGISVLGAEYLIPFKMFAWLDLRNKKSLGEHVNEKDLKKHKYDVFRLLQIVQNDARIETNGLVRKSILEYLDIILDENIPFSQLGLPFEKDVAISLLSEIYIV